MLTQARLEQARHAAANAVMGDTANGLATLMLEVVDELLAIRRSETSPAVHRADRLVSYTRASECLLLANEDGKAGQSHSRALQELRRATGITEEPIL